MSIENVEAVEPENSTHEVTEAPSFEEDVANLLAGSPDPQTEKPEEVGEAEPQEPDEGEEQETLDPEAESEEEDLSFLDEEVEEEKPEADFPKGVQKRIDKLTAQKYELSEENEKLKAQVAELESQPRETSNQGVQFNTEEDVDRHERAMLNYVDFADEALLRYESDPETVEGELDKAVPDWRTHTEDAELFLKRVKMNSNRALRQVPKQREAVRRVQTENLTAQKAFPWLADESNKKTQWVENQIRKFPEAGRIPGVKKILAYAITGMAQEKRQTGKRPAIEPTPQPKRVSRPSKGGGQDPLKAASERVKNERSRESLAGFISAAKQSTLR